MNLTYMDDTLSDKIIATLPSLSRRQLDALVLLFQTLLEDKRTKTAATKLLLDTIPIDTPVSDKV